MVYPLANDLHRHSVAGSPSQVRKVSEAYPQSPLIRGDVSDEPLIDPTQADFASDLVDEVRIAVRLPNLRVLVVDDG